MHGIDFSSLVPHGLFESSASYSGAPVHNIFQSGFGDFTRVQEPYWWLMVPESVREFWSTAVVKAPPQVKGAAATGLLVTALWAKTMLGSWSNKKHGGGDDNEHEL